MIAKKAISSQYFQELIAMLKFHIYKTTITVFDGSPSPDYIISSDSTINQQFAVSPFKNRVLITAANANCNKPSIKYPI
jgi:hypothetical protein